MLTKFKESLLENLGIKGSVLGSILTDTQLQLGIINELPKDIDYVKVMGKIKEYAYHGQEATKIIGVTFDNVAGTAAVRYEYQRDHSKANDGSDIRTYSDTYRMSFEDLDKLNAIIW